MKTQIVTNSLKNMLCMAICFTMLACGTADFASGQDAKLKLSSAGPIAFGPGGLLLVSDPMAATIYAIETGDAEGSTDGVSVEVADVRTKVAAMMGGSSADVRINDLAINPVNGTPYLSVSRGSGETEISVIMKIDPKSKKISEVKFDGLKYSKTSLPNAPESKESRRGNQRMSSITDIAFVDDQVYVAGLSNEEFASNLRAIPYPFKAATNGASIEIYHGAHGKYETRSPVRTFAAYEIDDEMNLLAAYTCTPLVRIPVASLQPETKVKGTTIAELGNRNRPLDMVVYKKDGKDYALMANSSRGVMKIELENAGKQQAITTRVSGTSGVKYTTIKELTGVMQLDGLSPTHAVILQKVDGKENLKTIPLP